MDKTDTTAAVQKCVTDIAETADAISGIAMQLNEHREKLIRLFVYIDDLGLKNRIASVILAAIPLSEMIDLSAECLAAEKYCEALIQIKEPDVE